MLHRSRALLVVGSLLAAACFNDGGPGADATGGTGGTGESTGDAVTTGETADPSILEQCTDHFARRTAIAAANCQCQVDQGKYADVAACLAATGGAMPPVFCTCEIYGRSPETLPGLECAAPGQMAAIACLDGLSCATDSSAVDSCINAYYTAISTCAAPPPAVASEVAIACDGVPALMCGSGESIPETWKCDQKSDCMDGSDEADCAGMFACKDGNGSIDEALRCDDIPDCADKSDELDCPTFMCTTGKVIPLIYRCDGISDCCTEDEPDCADQSDELNCPTFMCADGMTIPEQYRCDGIEDCDDKSDELNCTDATTGP